MLASLALIAGVVVFMWQGLRLGREYVWLERASAKGIYSDEQIAALEKAYAAEPKNSETPLEIGEAYRVQCSEGGENYQALAQQALLWLSRGTNCNPYDDRIYVALGRCLDWLERPNEAFSFFSRADELDPNGYYTSAFMGWHYIQIKDYAAARAWLDRSLRLQRKDNDLAVNYIEIVNTKLLEGATNQNRGPFR